MEFEFRISNINFQLESLTLILIILNEYRRENPGDWTFFFFFLPW